MALIKHNIVPNGYAQHGRFMPHKDVKRVWCGKENLMATTETSYNFSKGFFVPDDCRNEDGTGSLIYRIGGIINDYNTADENIGITITSLTLYGVEIEGLALTENAVTGGRYTSAVPAARFSTGGTEPRKYGVFAQLYNIAGTVFSGNINGTNKDNGAVYFEADRTNDPTVFDVATVNPMAYMILELVFTLGTISESHSLDICTFVDFANMKD